MDIKELIAKANKAREYVFACNGRSYTLRLPSEHEARVAYFLFARDDAQKIAGWAQAQRYLLERALIGWQNVVATDILPDVQAPLPIAYHTDMVPVLLDALDDDACAMASDMADRLKARTERLEESAKN